MKKPSGTHSLICIISLLLLVSCRTVHPAASAGEIPVPLTEAADEILHNIPDYSASLHSAKGKARAIISEPGNNERVTLHFDTDKNLSLLTVKNRIGIEGGKLLVDRDSILIYNKTEQFAQKISVQDSRMTGINELASANFLDLLNFKLNKDSIKSAMQTSAEYIFILNNKGTVYVDKKNSLVTKVVQPPASGLPYSEIQYSSYNTIEGFKLPGKIAIFSNDRQSKINLQLLDLKTNPQALELTLTIPKDLTIERP